MRIIPKPNGKLNYGDGTYIFKSVIQVDLGDFTVNCINVFLARTGYDLLSINNGSVSDICLMRDETLSIEEYRLNVSAEGVNVYASNETAIIWALTTLYELIDENETVVFCDVHDFPKYEHRGLLLDCARHFFPAVEVKKVIEQMSLVKMNVLHWHLTDDQGWRIESKIFPTLHETSGEFFTQEEIKDVIEFASVRGIEVVPEIDMPGHSRALLTAYPEHSCSGVKVNLAKQGGIYPIILCPGKDETFDFVEALLDEVCELFSTTRIHIGGDEAPKTEWEKCEHCRKRMEAEELPDTKELQGYFSNRLSEYLKEKGKKVVLWNDSLESSNLSVENQIQYWSVQYEEYIPKFIENGGKIIVSDMFYIYFDYPHSMSSLKKIYNYKPVIADTDYSDHPSVLGLEACIWTEHIGQVERLEQLLFPRLFALAEITWTNNTDYEDFISRIPDKLNKLINKGIYYTSLEKSNPVGEDRIKETFAYFGTMNANLAEGTAEAVQPNPAFIKNFTTKFFEPSDLPLLEKFLRKRPE